MGPVREEPGQAAKIAAARNVHFWEFSERSLSMGVRRGSAAPIEDKEPQLDHLDPHFSSWKTVNEAAELLKVNPSTVRRWISQDILTAVRIGKTTLRVDLSSLRFETLGAAA